MTKRQDLCLQRRSRPEQSDQYQPDQAANISHQPRASPNSTPLASRIKFPTMTGIKDLLAESLPRNPEKAPRPSVGFRRRRAMSKFDHDDGVSRCKVLECMTW